MRRRLLPLAALLSACTLDAGQGFATLETAELEVLLDPASARIADHTIVTDLGYRVTLDAFELGLGPLELQELVGGAGLGDGTFDPANPPPGFTLCHGGHCHSEAGGLVSYEEIQAMLSGGTVTYEPLATLPVDGPVDVLAAEPPPLSEVEPSRELPLGTISRVFVPIERLVVSGTASGGPLGEGTVPVAIDAAVTGEFLATATRPVDRDHPQRIDLAVTVPIPGTIFDGVELATEEADAQRIADALSGTDLRVTFD